MSGHPLSIDRAALAGRLAPSRNRIIAGCLTVAAVGLTAAIIHAAVVESGGRRFMLAYLVAFAFVLSLSLGAIFLVLIQHVTRAGWSVLVRRMAEALAMNVALAAVLFVPIAVSVVRGQGELYPWARPIPAVTLSHGDDTHLEASPHSPAAPGYEHQILDEHTLVKRAWLNAPLFLGRWVVFFLIWWLISRFFWRTSVRQDESAGDEPTRRMETFAAPSLLLFALTITLAAADLLMSLNPHWSSTVFGVYYFTGGAVGVLATIILLMTWFKRAGMMSGAWASEHAHDLGKLLFAFTFFWGYIAYSQYMLIWYANVPEATGWLAIRGASTAASQFTPWSWVLLALLAGHFLAPFLGLMTRHVKRHRTALALWAAWMLVMHWFDLFWIVMPEMGPSVTLGAIEVGLAVSLSSLSLAWLIYTLSKHSLVPLGDPRLEESLRFENI